MDAPGLTAPAPKSSTRRHSDGPSALDARLLGGIGKRRGIDCLNVCSMNEYVVRGRPALRDVASPVHNQAALRDGSALARPFRVSSPVPDDAQARYVFAGLFKEAKR